MKKAKPRTKLKTPAATPAKEPAAPFPIIGIGASAGGLQALEAFLKAVPAKSGHAFVVVQHLDPTRTAMLAQLLQRGCAIPVVEITNGMVVEPDHVYVIPPDSDLSILNSVLHVMEPTTPRGQRLPIDSFFSALGADRRARSVGVILSGMGSDGAAGVRAIKAHKGSVFVQSLDSAQFDGMPRSAIASGQADGVAPPEKLHALITQHLKGVPRSDGTAQNGPNAVSPGDGPRDPQADDLTDDLADDLAHDPTDDPAGPVPPITGTPDNLSKVILLVRTQTGHDFSQYKRTTLTRRVARRMHVHRLVAMADYVQLLQSDPREAERLFNDLLIGVTQFFRDPAAWDELARSALPQLIERRPEGGVLRAWVPGCSSGEEAFSLAIVFREVLARLQPKNSADFSVQIFGTDLDKGAIAKARAAVYPTTIAKDVSQDRLRRFFVPDDQGHRLSKAIREMVVFAPQNLVMDPPFTKLDLISCRNLLIYLTPELHKKLLPLFHYSLEPDGVLFLGTAETIGTDTELFAPIVDAARIYRRLDAPRAGRRLEFPSSFTRTTPTVSDQVSDATSAREATLRSAVEHVLLLRFAPAALVVDAAGKIIYTFGDAQHYVELANGAPSSDRLASSNTALGAALIAGLADAVRDDQTVTLDDLVVGSGADAVVVRVAITPMVSAEVPTGSYLVVFNDVTSAAGAKAVTEGAVTLLPKAQANRLERELDARCRELELARQDKEASQQELRSTNEELQSANEELTTSKEEMQSMNEELQTVNHELQAKLDELTLASNDMNNLLNSTRIATLFLDAGLLVRRFTTPTTSIIRLIPGDVGRPITDIVSALNFPEMAEVSRDVLRTLVVFEREVSTSDGRWFVVRIMPYRTHDDLIDGLVLTFTDATKGKTLEAALRRAQGAMEGKLATQAAELDATTQAKEKP